MLQQQRQRNVQKSVPHVQRKFFFRQLHLPIFFFFCRSCCRRRLASYIFLFGLGKL